MTICPAAPPYPDPPYARDELLHEIFAATAAAIPDRTALRLADHDPASGRRAASDLRRTGAAVVAARTFSAQPRRRHRRPRRHLPAARARPVRRRPRRAQRRRGLCSGRLELPRRPHRLHRRRQRGETHPDDAGAARRLRASPWWCRSTTALAKSPPARPGRSPAPRRGRRPTTSLMSSTLRERPASRRASLSATATSRISCAPKPRSSGCAPTTGCSRGSASPSTCRSRRLGPPFSPGPS